MQLLLIFERRNMGEENVEQRIMMSRYWADSSTEWFPVVGPITVEIDEAEGKDQTTIAFKNLDEAEFHVTAEIDEQTLRKAIGLPAIPTKKPKCHKNTFKKALMAYGYSRDTADAICQIIGGRQHNRKQFLGTKAWNRATNKIEVIHWGYKFYYEHVFTILGD